jgi:hypothetical protein
MLLRILFILSFSFVVSNANSQSTLKVFNRKTYLDIRCELSDIPILVKKYASSELPIHLDISPDKNIKENHFEELAKLPLTFMRFSVSDENVYCKGIDLLQSLDSLELSLHSHPFLKDASKLKELKFLELYLFMPDSSIKESAAFDQLTKMRIHLSRVTNLSSLFSSLKNLIFLDFTKNINQIDLSSSMTVLNTAPINKLCFGLCNIDTTNFKTAVFPSLKKVWLVGVSNSNKNFDFEQFIEQNPSLEFMDIRMNSIKDGFLADLRKKFPNIKIDRDW